jgi:hypothetical protein
MLIKTCSKILVSCFVNKQARCEMRCVVTLTDGSAMERAVEALAKYPYAGGEPVAPEGHPREWKRWLLEINSAELEAIRDHVNDGDIVDIKPVNETAISELH